MPRERKPEALKQFNRHMGNAEREFKKGVERFAALYDTVPPRKGHEAEMCRRLQAYRDELDRGIAILDKRLEDGR